MLPLNKQNRYRAQYARLRPGWRSSGDQLEALARRYIGPEAQVLDVGCGRGGVLEVLGPAAGRAVGLDPDWRSLAEQRAELLLAAGRAEALPLAAEAFDVLLAVWVFEHLAQPAAALSEAWRVLRPGGRLVVLTPNLRHPVVWANRLSQLWPGLQRRLVPALYGRAEADTFRVHYRANTPARLAGLARAAGFSVDLLRAIPDPTYLAFDDRFFRLSVALERLLPEGWGVHLLSVLAKPA